MVNETLLESENSEKCKQFGELLTCNMHLLKLGMDKILVQNYYNNNEFVEIPLKKNITPSQNAQNYYREYTKKKTATKKMLEQIELAKEELDYAESIFSMLDHAENSADLMQIRQELSHWSYGRRLVSSLKKPQTKKEKPKPRHVSSPNGFSIYIGMNNFQNDTGTQTPL